jgi:hypothetical protein
MFVDGGRFLLAAASQVQARQARALVGSVPRGVSGRLNPPALGMHSATATSNALHSSGPLTSSRIPSEFFLYSDGYTKPGDQRGACPPGSTGQSAQQNQTFHASTGMPPVDCKLANAHSRGESAAYAQPQLLFPSPLPRGSDQVWKILNDT